MAYDIGPGTEMGGFRVIDELGRGGMGVVYRAEQVSLGREVALKVISAAYSTDPEFRARFHREATVQAAISSPHVVPVYATGEHDGMLWLAAQLVTGGDLRERIRRSGPLRAVEAVELTAQVAEALAEAHRAGVIHRDVKPNNILLRPGGRVFAYLTDFGVAAQADSDLTLTGTVVGTYSYLAPERCFGSPATPATDQYALGCVLVACLTGRAPYAGSDLQVAQQHHSAAVPQLPQHHPAASQLNPLLHRMLAKDPHDRFASMDGVIVALDELRSRLASPAAQRGATGDATEVRPVVPPDATLLRGAGGAGTSQHTVARPTRSQRPAAAPARGRRTLVGAVAAVVAVLVAGTAAGVVLLGPEDDDTAGATGTTATASPSVGASSSPEDTESSSPDPSPEPTETETETEAGEPLPGLAGLASFENPPCDDGYIVMVATAGTPEERGAKLQDAARLANASGARASYMQARLACEAMVGSSDESGAQIDVYNVFIGPFPSRAQACAARGRLVGDAAPRTWVRQLKVGTPKRLLCSCLPRFRDFSEVRTPGPASDDYATRRRVSEAQWAMYVDGIGSTEELSGNYGEPTAQKVATWQGANGLPVTGVLDRRTWERLVGGYCDDPRDPPEA